MRARASSSARPRATSGVGLHDQHQVEGAGLARLDEQRDVLDDDGVAGQRRDDLGRPRAHQRVDDAVQAGPGLRVAEHDRGQRRAVQDAVGGEHPVPERLRDRRQTGRPGCDDLAGEDVGVHQVGAPVDQQAGDRALARADPAGQSDPQHARTVARRRAQITER